MESEEQGTNTLDKPDVKPAFLVIMLLLYSAGFARTLFGSWHSNWFNPISGVSGCVFAGMLFEIIGMDRLIKRQRSYLVMLGVLLTYGLAPALIVEYRMPPVMSRVWSYPWDPIITLSLGIAVYAVMMARAIIIYVRNR